MDLNQIDIWTRKTLELEAQKRGVRNPHFRTRRELIGLILRHDYATYSNAGSLREAASLVAAAAQSATENLPSPLNLLARFGARLPLPSMAGLWGQKTVPRPSQAPFQAPPQEAQPQRTFRKPSVSDAELTPTPQAVVAPVARASREVAATPVAPPPAAAELVPPSAASELALPPTPSVAELSTPGIPSTQSMPAAPVVDAPRPTAAATRRFVEEPIRTHSMARLLAAQGHRERALTIYEELLAKNSADSTLQHEAQALRDNVALNLDASQLPQPSANARTALPAAGDRIECEQRGSSELAVRWAVTAEGQARARALLGNQGELAVRLVAIRPDPERVVRSEITEHGPIDMTGEWTTSLGDPSSRCFAAVGMRDQSRFVSIVHMQTGVQTTAHSVIAGSS